MRKKNRSNGHHGEQPPRLKQQQRGGATGERRAGSGRSATARVACWRRVWGRGRHGRRGVVETLKEATERSMVVACVASHSAPHWLAGVPSPQGAEAQSRLCSGAKKTAATMIRTHQNEKGKTNNEFHQKRK